MTMDRELSSDYLRRRKARNIIFSVGAVILLFSFSFGFRYLLKSRVDRSELSMSTAEIGRIDASVTASGIVASQYEEIITSPLRAKIERVIFPVGSSVQKGDSIIQLQFEETRNQYQKLLDEKALKQTRLQQSGLTEQKNQYDLKTNLDIKAMTIKSLETKLDNEKYLEGIGGSTKDQVKEAENQLEIARKEYAQLEERQRYEKAYHQTELAASKYEINLLDRNIDELVKKMERADIRASSTGVISWLNDGIGRWVGEGEALARIADMSNFLIEASISDSYLDQLRIGNEAIIRINDETDLVGSITHINPAIDNGSIKFRVQLKESNHPSLRANLRVEVFVITSFKDQVIRVENGPFYQGGLRQEVFVVTGDEAVRREIEIGETNFDYLEVKSGLNEGETIITSDMKDHLHKKSLTLIEE